MSFKMTVDPQKATRRRSLRRTVTRRQSTSQLMRVIHLPKKTLMMMLETKTPDHRLRLPAQRGLNTVSPARPPAESTSDKPRSHHQEKACPLTDCSFDGNDLRRHLLVHVKRGDLAPEAVERLLSIVHTGAEK